MVYSTIIEKLSNYMYIWFSILIKNLEAFLETDRSQEFLLHWDIRSDILVDIRGKKPFGHKNVNKRHGHCAHYH